MQLAQWLMGVLAIDPQFLRGLVAALHADPVGGVMTHFAAAGFRRPTQKASEPQTIGRRSVIHVVGVLVNEPWSWGNWYTSYGDLQDALRQADQAKTDETLLVIDSPGGDAAGAPETAELIRRLNQRKPIIAVGVHGMVASAAYWLGSAAGKLYLTSGVSAGSIGVVSVHEDWTAAAEKMGVKWTILRQPENKFLGSPYEALTAQAAEKLIDSQIAPTYEQFVAAVARHRRVSMETVEKTFGGGLTLPAEQAVAVGMADGIVPWPDFLEGPAAQPLAPAPEATGARGAHGAPAAIAAGKTSPAAQHESDGSVGGDRSVPSHPKEERAVKYGQKLRAWLFAHDLISALDAGDDIIAAALGAWFAARGAKAPEGDEAILAALSQPAASASSQEAPAGRAAPQTSPAAGSPSADMAAALRQAAVEALAGDQRRVAAVQATARALGLNDDDELLRAALLPGGPTGEQLAASVTARAIKDNRPVTISADRISGGESSLDRVATAAVDAILIRTQTGVLATCEAGRVNRATAEEHWRKQLTENRIVRELAGMSSNELIRTVVEAAGIRVDERTAEGYAKAFFRMHATAQGEPRVFARGHARIFGSSQAADYVAHGPGTYPRIMDGVAAKVVDFITLVAPTPYMQWAWRAPDAENFQPREMIKFGRYKDLPIHIDGKTYSQLESLPNQAAWLMVDEYGAEVGITPRMAQQDIFGVLTEGLTTLQLAAESCVNGLCVNLLIGNVTWLVDGTACYSHSNDITTSAGGAPNDPDQTRAMRKLLARQKLVGDSKPSGLQMGWALVGTEWQDEAREAYLGIEKLALASDITTAAQMYRDGSIRPLFDPAIDAASADYKTWYGGSAPIRGADAGVTFAFGIGYGPGGRRDSYYVPQTESMVYRIKTVAGAALTNAQALVRNAGSTAE